MPVDPQIQILLDKGTGVPATHTLSVPEARAQYEARVALMAPPAAVAKVDERRIAGPGGPLRLRVYRPLGTGPFPLLVFFHGSGFVLCSLDTHDGMCRNLCAGAGCVVVSVDYRLAPEHKFPAPLDDCVFATRWAIQHADELSADGGRVVLAGDSAGGNLAAATALRLRDEGGPVLQGQLLIYPVTDYHTPKYAILSRQRGRLRLDPRYDDLVLEPLPCRPSGRGTSLCVATARRHGRRVAADPRGDRRVRSAVR